jgi:hypothetical protein
LQDRTVTVTRRGTIRAIAAVSPSHQIVMIIR